MDDKETQDNSPQEDNSSELEQYKAQLAESNAKYAKLETTHKNTVKEFTEFKDSVDDIDTLKITIEELTPFKAQVGERDKTIADLTKERDLLVTEKTDSLKGRLQAYGLKEESYKSKSLGELQAMETAILAFKPQDNSGPSSKQLGLGNTSKSRTDEKPKTAYDQSRADFQRALEQSGVTL